MTQAISRDAASVARPTRYRWAVLALIFLIYSIASADRANIGIALPFMQKEFGLTNTEVGGIVSLFALAYGIFQIPSSFLVRRFGVRAVMPTFMILTSAFTATMGMASSGFLLQLNRFALGVAEAPLANSLITTVNNWFAPQEKGQAAGIFISSAKFGPVIVPPLGAFVILHFGWQYIFFICAIPGVILPLLWLMFVPDNPADSRFCSQGEVDHISQRSTPNSSPTKLSSSSTNVETAPSYLRIVDRLIRARRVVPISSTGELVRSWTAWGAALGYFFCQGIISVILAWLPTYLTKVKQFSILNVGFVSAAPFVGAVAGNILGGWLSDRVFDKRRKPTMMLSTIATVVMMYALVFAPNDPVALAFLLFMTGFLLSLGLSAFGIFPAAMTTKTMFPISTALVNTCGQLGGAAIPFIVGVVLDRADWNAVFLFLSACSFLALCLLLSIVEPVEHERSDTL